jgi:predicted AAA+ superfamily ATPase
LHPFDLTEVPATVSQYDLWFRGGFPEMLFARSNSLAIRWMENFISTYLNRDLLQLGLNASPKLIRNLWVMMAHLNGQLLNSTSIANSIGVTSPTIIRYINFLEEAFLLYTLHPFSWNIKKRIVKSPKVYLSDTGILHHLLNINNFDDLPGNPIIGSSWESFVINQIASIKSNQINLYFYRTHHKAEVDLVFTRGLKVVATAEIKYSNSPQLTKGNFQAIDDLKAQVNFVITPSSDDYLMKEHIRVCSLKTFIFNYLPAL